MEKIRIFYGIQGSNIVFKIDMTDRQMLKSAFPDVQFAESIVVGYDRKNYNPTTWQGQLERRVLPALLGFSDPNFLKKFEKIDFIKTPGMEVTYTIEPTNESKIQSVLG